MRTMSRQLWLGLGLLMVGEWQGLAQQFKVAPEVVDAAVSLFPGAAGPFELRYKVDIRMHNQGFEIYNYNFCSAGKELGLVTRVTSVAKDGPASNVDLLVRYDEKGTVTAIRNLKLWKVGQGEVDINGLLDFLTGKDLNALKEPLNILVNGLAAAGKYTTIAPPKPPEGFVLDLRQKILTPGAKLPNLKATAVNGQPFDTAALAGKPLVLVFASTKAIRCDDMIRAMEKGVTQFGQAPEFADKAKSLTVAYVVSQSEDNVRAYADGLDLGNRLVIAEPTDNLSKLFQVPFKPYALLFDETGTLKFNTPWEDEGKLYGMFYLLLGGKAPVQP